MCNSKSILKTKLHYLLSSVSLHYVLATVARGGRCKAAVRALIRPQMTVRVTYTDMLAQLAYRPRGVTTRNTTMALGSMHLKIKARINDIILSVGQPTGFQVLCHYLIVFYVSCYIISSSCGDISVIYL